MSDEEELDSLLEGCSEEEGASLEEGAGAEELDGVSLEDGMLDELLEEPPCPQEASNKGTVTSRIILLLFMLVPLFFHYIESARVHKGGNPKVPLLRPLERNHLTLTRATRAQQT